MTQIPNLLYCESRFCQGRSSDVKLIRLHSDCLKSGQSCYGRASGLAGGRTSAGTYMTIDKATQEAEVIAYIRSHACNWSKVPDSSAAQWGIHQLDTPPHNRLLGPVFARGETAGIVSQYGKPVLSWGDTDRADMSFSVTKTYLALTAGIAFDQGILPDLDEPVVVRLPGLGFDDEHNRQVSWRHLLQFTSEWEGTCFGVPDQIDRYRQVSMQPQMAEGRKGDRRPLQIPGSYWEYNDVRINQFSLALLHLFGQAIPDVFDQHIMKPLNASRSWRWHGYDNSWVSVQGQALQSVPGGGHWGGGMVISVNDQLQVAQLFIDGGTYQGQQLISRTWIDKMLTPCTIAPHYGFFTWLNTNHCVSTVVPEESYFSIGIGGQFIWHDPTRAVAAVFRWLDSTALNDILTRVNALLE